MTKPNTFQSGIDSVVEYLESELNFLKELQSIEKIHLNPLYSKTPDFIRCLEEYINQIKQLTR